MSSIFSKEDKEQIRTQLLAEGREMMLKRGITKMNIDELAIENKDFMHQEALETNFQMIVDCMYRYVKGES